MAFIALPCQLTSHYVKQSSFGASAPRTAHYTYNVLAVRLFSACPGVA